MVILRTLSVAALIGVLPSLVQGISLTSPASTDVITKGSDITATWTSVDTDPSVFSLYLWNFVQWPPYYEGLAYGVDTTAGELTVRVPCHINNGEGWQLTAINDTNVYVLYAQGAQFNITGDSCTDPATSASCYAPTSTVYVTQTAGKSNCQNVEDLRVTQLIVIRGCHFLGLGGHWHFDRCCDSTRCCGWHYHEPACGLNHHCHCCYVHYSGRRSISGWARATLKVIRCIKRVEMYLFL